MNSTELPEIPADAIEALASREWMRTIGSPARDWAYLVKAQPGRAESYRKWAARELAFSAPALWAAERERIAQAIEDGIAYVLTEAESDAGATLVAAVLERAARIARGGDA
jgi:hypothetical protein